MRKARKKKKDALNSNYFIEFCVGVFAFRRISLQRSKEVSLRLETTSQREKKEIDREDDLQSSCKILDQPA